jgi:hypothetical protein
MNTSGGIRKEGLAPRHKEPPRDSLLGIFAKWAVVLALTAASLAALGLHLRLFYSDPTLFRTLVIEHVRALIGIPLAAASAFCILLIFEAREGHIEFQILGIHFRGGAGPAVIWIFSFLAIVTSIRLLW